MVIAFDKIFQEKKDEWVLGGFVTKLLRNLCLLPHAQHVIKLKWILCEKVLRVYNQIIKIYGL